MPAPTFAFHPVMEWISPHLGRPQGRVLGMASIIAADFLLSLSDALVKAAGIRFALGQIIFLRSLIAIVFIVAAILLLYGAAQIRVRISPWVWARSLCLTAMWLCYYAALPLMSFPLAAACYYTSPAWMALLSRLVLSEPVGARGWLAIVVSLSGVALAVDPIVGTMSPTLLLPLAAAVFYALAGIITWRRCQNQAASAMALNLNCCLCLVSGAGIVCLACFSGGHSRIFALSVWPHLSPNDWYLVGTLGVLLAVIATAVSLAYRLAPTPVVGVFDTTYLAFAALWGMVLFGDIPTPREALGISAIGMGAILMSGRDNGPIGD